MLHKLHRVSALIIGTFVLFHLANHLMAFSGVARHIEIMELLRRFYRYPLVEIVLLACVGFQIASGVFFIKSRWGKRVGFFEKVQALSGAYLVFFLLVHVGAVLAGRAVFNLDTNFYFAAAGLNIFPASLFFYPYYTLAVAAFFTHVGCAIHWLARERLSVRARNRIGTVFILFGFLLGITIVLLFGGIFFEIQIPENYLATYR
ncbi:MAG: hypothetical protein L3J32_12165 [Rhizobiaceae bacterium]|nr:hypothetical protein [Rhizobiaceae bacterium]